VEAVVVVLGLSAQIPAARELPVMEAWGFQIQLLGLLFFTAEAVVVAQTKAAH
jgi:hypothetical protein